MFRYVVFKLHKDWSNAYISAPTPVGTFHGLNCFGHLTYMLQTRMDQNIVRLDSF